MATRRTALTCWCVLTAGSVVLTVVAATFGPGIWPRVSDAGKVVAWVVFGMALAGLLLSKVVASRLKAVPGATPESFAVGQSVIASALNGSMALCAPLAWMVSGKIIALLGLAISLVGLLLAFPSERRWQKLRRAVVVTNGQELVAGANLWTSQPLSRKVLGFGLLGLVVAGTGALLLLMGNKFWTEEVLRRPSSPIVRALLLLILSLMMIGFAVVDFMGALAGNRPRRQRVLLLAYGVLLLVLAGYLLVQGLRGV